jgi:hypothetical protein
VLHNTRNGITAFAATKILKNALGGDYIKRGCFLVRKGAQSLIILTGPFKRNKVANHIYDVNSAFYFIYAGTGNHARNLFQELGPKDSQ